MSPRQMEEIPASWVELDGETDQCKLQLLTRLYAGESIMTACWIFGWRLRFSVTSCASIVLNSLRLTTLHISQ